MRFTISQFLICLSIFLPFAGNLTAQDNLSIGQWRSYLPYGQAITVTEGDEAIYFGTDLSFISIDKSDNSISYFNKISGLSDIGLSFLKYDKISKTLVVVYSNGNIDLLNDGKIKNIPSILQSINIAGDKSVYHAFFSNGFAYLSCGFGVVKLDLDRQEVAESNIANIRYNGVSSLDGTLYAAAADGIYSIAENTANFSDFNNWEQLNGLDGLPIDIEAGLIEFYDGKIYAEINENLYEFDGNNWSEIYQSDAYKPIYLFGENENLLLTLKAKISGPNRMAILTDSVSILPSSIYCTSRVKQAIQDENGRIWLSDQWFGMQSYSMTSNACEVYSPVGPYSNSVNNISVYDDEVWIASGGVNTNWQFQFNRDGIFSFINQEWTTYNESTQTEMKDVWDFLEIVNHPNGTKAYASSYGRGLLEINKEDGSIQVFNDGYLQGTIGNEASFRVSGLGFDEDEDLWLLNYGAPDPMVRLNALGEFERWDFGSENTLLTHLAIDQNGYKWIVNRSKGLIVFDEKGEDGTGAIPRYKIINSSNSELPNNTLNCVEVDLDGDVWVGTSEGAIVFQCPGQVFTNGCLGTRKIIDIDGIPDYLLVSENIMAIGIDGGNRKWFGTENGIFVQSPNGEKQEHYFNTENSPLFNNSITSIEFMGSTGEVFIGTQSGLISYRGEATSGGIVHASDALAFPNPVRPNYEGPIAIKGLVTDADIKITDISGKLVYETTAYGGQVVWNGRDYNGRKPQSGVYLVYSSNEAGNQTLVTKILFMN